ncbi:hypothetical protein C0389_07315 [bacterium]|nr:hypothetical protein [bacterium]
MNKPLKAFLFWAPRLITILFAMFLTIFAADVFTSGYEFWKIPIALFMHLLPSILIIIILVISWKREWIGGILYIALSVFYTYAKWNKFAISVFFIIPLPLFLVGVLFLIGWFKKTKIE